MIVSGTIQVSRRWVGRGWRNRPHYSSRHYHGSIPLSSISRMLDMGGAPSASSSKNSFRNRNTSKNSKIQAVAFDFELLVKTIHEQADEATEPKSTIISTTPLPAASAVKPDIDQVQEVANLLNVDLSEGKRKKDYEEDDLSALLAPEEEPMPKKETPKPKPKSNTKSNPLSDIRSKYADKLHKKGVDGGIAGVELVKHQREEALKRGDAEGHLAARAIAMTSASSQSGTRWMALTGTGKLLSTLTHRSMKIALLPRIPHSNNQQDPSPKQRMEDLTKQLKDVVFDVLVDLPTNTTEATPEAIMVKNVLEKLGVEPQKLLIVSDQDTFLKPAKELGMMTCRIRPLNARRGNVSAHHTIESVLQVHDVVNEMNGISYNAVLNM